MNLLPLALHATQTPMTGREMLFILGVILFYSVAFFLLFRYARRVHAKVASVQARARAATTRPELLTLQAEIVRLNEKEWLPHGIGAAEVYFFIQGRLASLP